MRITEREINRTIILSTDGQFVFQTRKKFKEILQAALDKAPRHIVVNLEKVDYIDSAGLGLLLLAAESAKNSNIALSLVPPLGKAREVLKLANFSKMVPFFSSEDEAIKGTTMSAV